MASLIEKKDLSTMCRGIVLNIYCLHWVLQKNRITFLIFGIAINILLPEIVKKCLRKCVRLRFVVATGRLDRF